jgi:hypothetical protein
MAEFINQHVEPPLDGFNAMGKPIPADQRQHGYDTCKEMGLDSARAWECVNATAEQLERDKPHEAQGAAMKFLDLTGAYRLMAVLLTKAGEQIKPVGRNADLRDGTTIRDGEGKQYRVHYMRNSLIVAHPIVDGKAQVSRDTTVRFWTDPDMPTAGENDRTDPVYVVSPPTAPATKPRREATARMLRDYPKVQTVWLVEVPHTNGRTKQYKATTYPDSELIFLESSPRGRAIAAGNTKNLLPAVREAIAKARTATTQEPTGEPQ